MISRNFLNKQAFVAFMEDRYSRQAIIEEIGKKGQKMLKESRVAIVGIGALGTVAAELLARAGIGTLLLIDRDIVELHNLHRQHIFTEEDCHKPKAAAATEYLQKVNSTITIQAETTELTWENVEKLKGYDLILDCTDNMETRFLLNDLCVKYQKPWIYCGAIETKGHLLVITPQTPCFRCIFSLPPAGSLETCDTVGVLNTITTAMATFQVTEALKFLTQHPYTKELIVLDIWKRDFAKIKVKKKADCPCCERREFPFLEGKKQTTAIKLCGQDRIQIKGVPPNRAELEKRLKKVGKVKKSVYGLYFETKNRNFFIFNDGRCLIKAKTPEEGKRIYAEYVGN